MSSNISLYLSKTNFTGIAALKKKIDDPKKTLTDKRMEKFLKIINDLNMHLKTSSKNLDKKNMQLNEIFYLLKKKIRESNRSKVDKASFIEKLDNIVSPHPYSKLPFELIALIFSLLHESKDIKALRLVNMKNAEASYVNPSKFKKIQQEKIYNVMDGISQHYEPYKLTSLPSNKKWLEIFIKNIEEYIRDLELFFNTTNKNLIINNIRETILQSHFSPENKEFCLYQLKLKK